jgi:type II secretory pathway component PulJ
MMETESTERMLYAVLIFGAILAIPMCVLLGMCIRSIVSMVTNNRRANDSELRQVYRGMMQLVEKMTNDPKEIAEIHARERDNESRRQSEQELSQIASESGPRKQPTPARDGPRLAKTMAEATQI